MDSNTEVDISQARILNPGKLFYSSILPFLNTLHLYCISKQKFMPQFPLFAYANNATSSNKQIKTPLRTKTMVEF